MPLYHLLIATLFIANPDNAVGALHWGEGFGPSAHAQPCGCSVNWPLTSYMLGIRPGRPGFAEAIIGPRPGDLTSAKGEVATPQGLIKVEWRRKGEIIEAIVEAPKGIRLLTPNPKTRLAMKEASR